MMVALNDYLLIESTDAPYVWRMWTFGHVSAEEADRESFVCSSWIHNAEPSSRKEAGCTFSWKIRSFQWKWKFLSVSVARRRLSSTFMYKVRTKGSRLTFLGSCNIPDAVSTLGRTLSFPLGEQKLKFSSLAGFCQFIYITFLFSLNNSYQEIQHQILTNFEYSFVSFLNS